MTPLATLVQITAMITAAVLVLACLTATWTMSRERSKDG
jgi:hypothetical protein